MTLRGLAGKVGIVTGAGSGIGRAVARRLADEGVAVVVVDIDGAAVDALAKELDGLGVEADVTNEDDVERYVATAVSTYGGVDIFHNNAGIMPPIRPVTDIPAEEFDRVLAVNVRGVFLGLRAVVGPMLAAGRGSIVTTSSVGGLVGAAGASAYVASKHAVLGLTRSVALEVAGRGVRVNAVCPGTTDTAMHQRFEADVEAGGGSQYRELARGTATPMGRIAEAEEVAAVVAWLLSDESSYVTGGVYTVDGAYTTG